MDNDIPIKKVRYKYYVSISKRLKCEKIDKIVIELIKSNKRQIDVARLLSIDKSTIYRWYRRYKETGSVDAKGYGDNQDKIKVDPKLIEEIIKRNPSLTLWEIAKKIGNITDATVCNALKKLGYTFKKSHGYIKREMKVKEGNSWKE